MGGRRGDDNGCRRVHRKPSWSDDVPGQTELLLRLVLACALGGAIGLEREISGQGAGFRTHILVALGSCLFTLVSAYAFQEFLTAQQAHVSFDPSRIAAQIVTGVGFLGGGAILRSGTGVRGLTTAASLWVVAAIGVAAGAGWYGAAALSTGLAIGSLWGLRRVRRRVEGLRPARSEVVLEITPGLEPADVLQALRGLSVEVRRLQVEQEEDSRTMTLLLRLPAGTSPPNVAAILGAMPGVRNVEWGS
jgi:putative Mg2+ transporter-C (MgtC) family protein